MFDRHACVGIQNLEAYFCADLEVDNLDVGPPLEADFLQQLEAVFCCHLDVDLEVVLEAALFQEDDQLTAADLYLEAGLWPHLEVEQLFFDLVLAWTGRIRTTE